MAFGRGNANNAKSHNGMLPPTRLAFATLTGPLTTPKATDPASRQTAAFRAAVLAKSASFNDGMQATRQTIVSVA